MDSTVIVRCPASHRAEREYAAEVVLGRLLRLPWRLAPEDRSDVELALDTEPGGRVVVADVLFGEPERTWLTPAGLPSLPLSRWDVEPDLPELAVPEPLPVLFSAPGPGGALTWALDDGAGLGLDVFGSAFFLLTRCEEVAVPERDEHGRFPFRESIAYREGFLERPIVNEYAELLFALMKRRWPRLERPRRRSRLLVSHDIDFPFAGRQARREIFTSAGADLVRRRDAHLARRRLTAALRRDRAGPASDPNFTFGFIVREDQRHEVASQFNFMADAGGFGSVPYSLDEPWARSLLVSLHHGGHQIGFHPSYGTHRDGQRLRGELAALRTAAEREGIEQERWGGRHHWLCWENPTTWQLWHDAGLDFDGSLGYDEVPGFRSSVCHPYPGFNVETGRRLAIDEQPLAWMDVTYMGFMGLGPTEAVARAVELYETCRRHDGDLCLLWHNDSLVSRGQQAAYVELLDRLA